MKLLKTKRSFRLFSLNFILQKASYGLGDNNESISHHKSRLVDNTHITQIKLQQK